MNTNRTNVPNRPIGTRRLRAAAHIHSEWSHDAAWPLEKLAASFRKRGYDLLLMCEHSEGFSDDRLDRYVAACERASSPELLVVPGIEYNDEDNVVHIPVWGDVPFLGETPDIPEVLAKAAAADGVAVFAHPWRRNAWQRYQDAWAEHLTAVEIWNRKYDGWAPRPEAIELARSQQLREWVSLDFHTARQFFPLAMALDVTPTGAHATREDVFDALRAGRFEPLAFSRAALRLASGVTGRMLAAAEAARSVAAKGLRKIR